jgi:hypothetical protein
MVGLLGGHEPRPLTPGARGAEVDGPEGRVDGGEVAAEGVEGGLPVGVGRGGELRLAARELARPLGSGTVQLDQRAEDRVGRPAAAVVGVQPGVLAVADPVALHVARLLRCRLDFPKVSSRLRVGQ